MFSILIFSYCKYNIFFQQLSISELKFTLQFYNYFPIKEKSK